MSVATLKWLFIQRWRGYDVPKQMIEQNKNKIPMGFFTLHLKIPFDLSGRKPFKFLLQRNRNSSPNDTKLYNRIYYIIICMYHCSHAIFSIAEQRIGHVEGNPIKHCMPNKELFIMYYYSFDAFISGPPCSPLSLWNYEELLKVKWSNIKRDRDQFHWANDALVIWNRCVLLSAYSWMNRLMPTHATLSQLEQEAHISLNDSHVDWEKFEWLKGFIKYIVRSSFIIYTRYRAQII